MMRFMYKPNGIELTNISVGDMVSSAYVIRQDLVYGLPDWASSVPFDLNAKVADEDVATFKKLNSRQRSSMLVPVLEDRFQLKAHKETRTLPVYELVVDKGGPKLPVSTAAEAKPGDAPGASGKATRAGMITMGPGLFSAAGASLTVLVNQLAFTLQRTVIDKTGLTGKYDIDLHWSPTVGMNAASASGANELPDDMAAAVHEQLGLKLVPSKGPVETLVVDHIQKPSEN